ncbi:hypothetical protein FQA39_LY01813 [Lamprigera yunnana]|nr:hypothetical protein FQA39_LY01813 [Lamprigera yunnana]
MWSLFSVILIVLIGSSWQDEVPIANTSMGTVKGHYKHSYGKRKFAAFEGIPYIKPPVGDLRFEEPQTPEPWAEVFEATKLHTCMQKFKFFPAGLGKEDCVYLNVYVPRTQPIPKENLDVIVHIHGGGFVAGSSYAAGPSYLMDKDIVYVNLNYRLGIFGFLSTEDSEIPGNYGLKDQVFALKWIQDNIEYFGGNPKSVTITGLAAGGASVHYHYLSPLSKGLFHRGLSQSGTAIAPWAVVNNPLEYALKLGKAVECSTESTKALKECLKSKSAESLYDKMKSMYGLPSGFPIVPFGPVIEKTSKTAFLTKHPYLLLKKGKVHDIPWITSGTTDEGLLVLKFLNFTLEDVENNWNHDLPFIFDYYSKVKEADKATVAERIKEFYINKDTSKIKNFVKAFGDRLFVEPLDRGVRLQAKVTKSPVYVQIYGYEADVKAHFPIPNKFRGVDHGANALLMYDTIFPGLPELPEKLSDSDEKIKDFQIEMLVSFAKSGVPTLNAIEWKSVSGGKNIEYLFVENPNNISMKYSKELCPLSFWESLPIYENEKLDTKEEL